MRDITTPFATTMVGASLPQRLASLCTEIEAGRFGRRIGEHFLNLCRKAGAEEVQRFYAEGFFHTDEQGRPVRDPAEIVVLVDAQGGAVSMRLMILRATTLDDRFWSQVDGWFELSGVKAIPAVFQLCEERVRHEADQNWQTRGNGEWKEARLEELFDLCLKRKKARPSQS